MKKVDLRKYPFRETITAPGSACAFDYLIRNNIEFNTELIRPGINDYGFPEGKYEYKVYFKKKENLHLFKLLFGK